MRSTNKDTELILNTPELKAASDAVTELLGMTVIEDPADVIEPVFVPKYKPAQFGDLWQAAKLSEFSGGNIAHNKQFGYLHYDGTVWQQSDEKVHALAQQLVDAQVKESSAMLDQATRRCVNLGLTKKKRGAPSTEADEAAIQALDAAAEYKHYAVLEGNTSRIRAALIEVVPAIHKQYELFDEDEFMLCCPDGDYDLRTGERHEHDREHYCTKQTAVSPSKADAKAAKLWDDTLQTLFCGDTALIDYVQLLAGTMLSGTAKLEMLVIAYGDGRNGKSSFFNVLAKCMGSYAASIDPSVLLVDREKAGSGFAPELATLQKMRMVIGAELPENCRMNTQAVKRITSTDQIHGCAKYRAPVDFWPTHTPVIYTNFLPRVLAKDGGTWRRLHVIPFNATIAGNAEIKDYAGYLFDNAGEYILAWMIDGAEKAISMGFKFEKPAAVANAIRMYREENDMVQRFLDECCVSDPKCRTQFGDLYNAYKQFLDECGDRSANRGRGEFRKALEEKEFFITDDRNNLHRKHLKMVEGLQLADIL